MEDFNIRRLSPIRGAVLHSATTFGPNEVLSSIRQDTSTERRDEMKWRQDKASHEYLHHSQSLSHCRQSKSRMLKDRNE
jgi:hypothetical protein